MKTLSLNTGTISARCLNGHQWTWAGSIDTMNLEGILCDCGQVTYHTEPCKECGHQIAKHKPIDNEA